MDEETPVYAPHSGSSTTDQFEGHGWSKRRLVLLGTYVLCALLLVSVFFATVTNQQRIERMHNNGIPARAIVTSCTGQIGGSGSNSAGYVCTGTYSVQHHRYEGVIGGLISLRSPGSVVGIVVDPDNLGSCETASLARSQRDSGLAYALPGTLTVLLLGCFLAPTLRKRLSPSPTSRD